MAVLDPVAGPAANLLAIGVADLLHHRPVGPEAIRRDRLGAGRGVSSALHELERSGLVSFFRSKGLQRGGTDIFHACTCEREVAASDK